MKTLAVILCGWLTGFFSIVVNYVIFSDTFWLLMPACVAAALAIGYVACRLPWASQHKGALTVAIFCGGLTAVTPMIVVSYGFALVVLVPLLAVWSALVLLGTHIGDRLHRKNK